MAALCFIVTPYPLLVYQSDKEYSEGLLFINRMKKRLIFVQINGQDLKEIKKEFKSMHLGKRSKRGEKKERWGRIGETNIFIFLSRTGRDRQRRTD